VPARQREPTDARLRVALARVFGERADLALRYADLLVTDGIERGLLGPREADRIWSRHIFNCAALAPLIGTEHAVVDLGSGAGLPGLPVALARPDLRVVLVEPMARRAAFLAECVATLGLSHVEVLRARAQDGLPAADTVIARAVAPLPTLAPLALPPASTAVLLALKGSTVATEAAELTALGGFAVEILEPQDRAGSTALVARVRRTT
jgi:16S rRNA (guanine527-N7)-methyltransferase